MAETNNQRDPLITNKASPRSSQSPGMSAVGSYIIPSLAGIRTVMGVGLLLSPQLICQLMQFSPQASANSTILTRMSGSREVGLGLVTWFAYRNFIRGPSANSGVARDLLYQVLLWGNIVVDGSDAVGSLIAFLTSQEEASAGALLAPSGLFAVVLGVLGLTSL